MGQMGADEESENVGIPCGPRRVRFSSFLFFIPALTQRVSDRVSPQKEFFLRTAGPATHNGRNMMETTSILDASIPQRAQ